MYRVEGVIRVRGWNQCVVMCPCEVCVCFAIVHVFWDGKDDDVVVYFIGDRKEEKKSARFSPQSNN